MRAIGWRLTTTACLFAFAGAALGAIAQPPAAQHPVPPPLWWGKAAPVVVGNEFKPNYGDHVVGSELSKVTFRKERTARLDDGVVVPGRDDLNLPAGEPLYAYNPGIVRAISDTPRTGPVIYDWYWCATPDPSRVVCLSWLSPGRIRVSRSAAFGLTPDHNPEWNWVEIAEPRITEMPFDFPLRTQSEVLREINPKGVSLATHVAEGSGEFSYASGGARWGKPAYIGPGTYVMFEPIRSPDGQITGAKMLPSQPAAPAVPPPPG